MRKRKLQLVHSGGRVAEPVSTVSHDEEAHLLDLADTALHNEPPRTRRLQAGERAREQHRILKQELQNTVEQVESTVVQKTGHKAA